MSENYDPTYRYLHDEIGIPDLSEAKGENHAGVN